MRSGASSERVIWREVGSYAATEQEEGRYLMPRSCESSWIALTEPPPRPHDEPGRDAVDGRDDTAPCPSALADRSHVHEQLPQMCLKTAVAVADRHRKLLGGKGETKLLLPPPRRPSCGDSLCVLPESSIATSVHGPRSHSHATRATDSNTTANGGCP